ncbi:ribose-phosphate pyrophosphokinase [Methylovirgula sp. HY1]|uniref:ribose-phosphate diphosphokinase n=1 Tax=Methylovirgula sp. HY1 TaxID=2822761 RepID=UPI001C78C71A|nr:ribose-phosphate pyrophosphokinase [Methylovirgula sp. HY1]QXX73331.1 Ribose-phosphate pyrophosphokinase 2 [Methylovirgula sp. HY1]
MTTLALTDPPLKRLFERLDYAPRPRDVALAALLAHWRVLRNGYIAPTEAALARDKLGLAARQAFRFRSGAAARSYILAEGATALMPLLGRCEIGKPLTAVENLRAAARLRRLFDTVQKAGEPVLAEFTLYHGENSAKHVEILAAPLAAGDEPSATSIFGGIAIREMAHRPLFRHATHMLGDEPMIFALKGAQALGEKIAAALALPLAPYEERSFEDGEHKLRPLTSVRRRHVFILDSLSGSDDPTRDDSVNDRLIKFAFFIATLRQAGARRISAVIPYLCYARKDRQTKSRDPIATRFVAQLLESMGVDEIISVTAHNLAAFQNAFRCPTIHLDTDSLFTRNVAPRVEGKKVSVVSPDLGGGKRAELLREALEQELARPVAKAFVDKQRSMGVVTGEIFAGDVAGATALILDDMIGTGETMIRAASACRQHGATEIYAIATHGLFIGADAAHLLHSSIDRFIVTDSIPLPPAIGGVLSAKLEIVSIADLIGEAIRIAHDGGAISTLLQRGTAPEIALPDPPQARH